MSFHTQKGEVLYGLQKSKHPLNEDVYPTVLFKILKNISFTLDNTTITLWLCLLLAKFCKNEQIAKSEVSTLLLCLLLAKKYDF